MSTLETFLSNRVVKSDSNSHQLTLARVQQDHSSLLRLTARTPDDSFFGDIVEQTQVHSNDVYYKYSLKLARCHLDCQLIEAASEDTQTQLLFEETPETYLSVTKNYIASLSEPIQLQTSSTERDSYQIIKETEGEEDIYLVVPNDPYLKSVRDLDARHIPLLNRIKTEASQMVASLLGFNASSLLISTKYPPETSRLTFMLSKSTFGLACGRNILLNDILYAIEVDASHFQTATLTYALPASHPLIIAIVNKVES